jgi:hypothetical protein
MNARSAEMMVVAGLAVILFLSPTAHAQDAELIVRVTDEQGLALVGASISVWDEARNLVTVDATDSDGVHVFDSLPAGEIRVEVTYTGFERYRRDFPLDPGESPTLTAELREVFSDPSDAIIVPTGRVEIKGVTDASISDPDSTGTSRFCAVAYSQDNVVFGTATADGALAVNQSFDFPGPFSCVMNRAGTGAYVGSRIENWIRRYERVGPDWNRAGDDFVLPGQRLGHLSLSPGEDLLQATQDNSIEILEAAATGLSHLRSIAIELAERTTALPGEVGFATAAGGVFSYPLSGNDPPMRIDEIENAVHLAPVTNRAALAQWDEAWALYLKNRRLATLWGITARPGAIVSLKRSVPYARTRSTEPVVVWADQNAAKLGRMTLRPDDPSLENGFDLHLSEIALRDFPLTETLPGAWNLTANSSGTVLATFPVQRALVAFKADLGSGCVPGPTTACTLGDRFEVEVDWRDFQDATGPARVVPGGSEDSELFYFFSPNNWEMLVKTLDGCGINNRFWVFAAATTNVEYTLRVTDTETGAVSTYTNPLGVAADAITDTQAFATCGGEKSARVQAIGSRRPVAAPPVQAAVLDAECTDTSTELCLNGGRYEVEVEWRDFADQTGSGTVAPLRSADSGIYWFFSANNWEMLVKVLDGCGINDNVWVFSAATTNVEYTLRVTDTATGMMREYFNPLGQAAPAITDTGAFACDP